MFRPTGRWCCSSVGSDLYMMDGANYAKALRNPSDPGIVETRLTTDGTPKYGYAQPLVPELAAALEKQDKADANDPKGMRQPCLAIHWSQDGSKFALVREDDRKVPELWTIHNLAKPRPQLETYSYAMPGRGEYPRAAGGDLHGGDPAARRRSGVGVPAGAAGTSTLPMRRRRAPSGTRRNSCRATASS